MNYNTLFLQFNILILIFHIFQGAEELNKAVKSLKDVTSLLPQLGTFLTFLDSVLEAEINFKVNKTCKLWTPAFYSYGKVGINHISLYITDQSPSS